MVSFHPCAIALFAAALVSSPFSSASVVAASNIRASSTGNNGLPSSHPPVANYAGLSKAQIQKYAANLNCPYASEWLTKGPEQAARDLAERHDERKRRRSLEGHIMTIEKEPMPMPMEISGSCTYANVWTGGDTCVEFRGPEWTYFQMKDRCDAKVDGGGTLSVGSEPKNYCGLPANGEKMAGWCVKNVQEGDMKGVEATMMAMGGPMNADCGSNAMACTTFAGGDMFVEDGACTKKEAEEDDADAKGGPPDWVVSATQSGNEPKGEKCQLAPGPAGAAHQAPFSPGYLSDCPGTPAESSPYQWPLRWSADTEMTSLSYTGDDVTYYSKSKVWYRLDKNWKRIDNYRQKGTLPFFARSTTETEEDWYLDEKDTSTTIHRGNFMYFFTYNNGTLGTDDPSNIKECNYLDLGIVGNVRPDWFLDGRGAATDAMYIGNQHIYYPGIDEKSSKEQDEDTLEALAEGAPRLVKQWRKKDFANQYFTMSMKEHVGKDGIHWPLVLNIPGEGFGDDMLQFYQNHRLLDEEIIEPFLLDEAYVAAGGVCNNLRPEGEGGGPPDRGEYIPSNLEIDDEAWFTNVWTGSPVYEEPDSDEESSEGASAVVGGLAITDAGPSTVVTSCYNADEKAVELSITYSDLSVTSDGTAPWLGLAFRKDEECLMNPRDGSDTEVALVLTDEFGALSPLHFLMSPNTKGMGATAGRNSALGFTPLEDNEDYSNVRVTHTENFESVKLKFNKEMGSVPDVMHLTYAIGISSTFGYHNVRTCFSVEEFPVCAASSTGSEMTTVALDESISKDSASGASILSFAFVSSMFVVSSLYMAIGSI